jgi:pyruvate kinase
MQEPREKSERSRLASAARQLRRLEQHIDDAVRAETTALGAVASERRECASNLIRYLALRQEDLRGLQVELTRLGLSSLGRSEMCVRRSVLSVSCRLHESLALDGDVEALSQLASLRQRVEASETWDTAEQLLHRHTRELLGPRPADRHVYVMVTAPAAAEADHAWMTRLLRAGMNILRINCAHEGPEQWERIVSALEQARNETGRGCRVLMDLAGPKIRSGPIGGWQRVVTWKPTRDEMGRPVAPAHVVLQAFGSSYEDANGPVLLVAPAELQLLRRGDQLHFADARSKSRRLEVQSVEPNRVVTSSMKRAYVLEQADAELVRAGKPVGKLRLVASDGRGAAIPVVVGDELLVTKRQVEGRASRRDRAGRMLSPSMIACTLPSALDQLDVGQRLLFDEGRIEAVVVRRDAPAGDFLVRVERTQKQTVKLRAEKGINLPDSAIDVPALSADDLTALEFVTRRADVVSLSFVRRPEDVRALRAELARLGRPDMGIVLKIETRAAFESLPRLLLEGLTRAQLGVMIARGDLAVEVGFERLAELQEEILWLCEAARVPVIWATQVLDTLARTGVPARAEVTDAAASVGAECVMLNKGPFVDAAVKALVDILRRMEQHHYKKRSLFRRLSVSRLGEQPSRVGDTGTARPG